MDHECILPRQLDPATPASAPDSPSSETEAPSPSQHADSQAMADDYAKYHRCWHHTMSGRRCRQPMYDPNSGLCRKHARVKGALDSEGFIADLSRFLTANPRHLDDLEGVHSFLSSLAVLLAQNRISTRRAAVLSYICTQLIRTNLAIEKRDAESDSRVPPRFDFPVPAAG